MDVFGPKYIGRVIDLGTLRDFILYHGLNEEDTILLHEQNLDQLGVEYRGIYHKPLPDPFFLLGVFIDEATNIPRVPLDRVVVVLDDRRPHRVELARAAINIPDDGRALFECDQCGGFVTPQGLPITDPLRREYINWLKVRADASTQAIPGECCVEA